MPKFLGGIYNHMISPTTGIILHYCPFVGLNSDYDHPYFPAISVAAKSEKLVFQAYRSSHINDDTHHFTYSSLYSRMVSLQDPQFSTRTQEIYFCPGAGYRVSRPERHCVILVNITAPTEILGQDFGQGPFL